MGLFVIPSEFFDNDEIENPTFSKNYYNLANSALLMAFAFLTNASFYQETFYDSAITILLEYGISAGVVGAFVFWGLQFNGGVGLSLEEANLLYSLLTAQTIMPTLLAFVEVMFDSITFDISHLWISLALGGSFCFFWSLERVFDEFLPARI